MLRVVVLCSFALAVLLVTVVARAESPLVVLVRPLTESKVVTEALTRIRGELVADGFEVAVVDAPSDTNPAAALARTDPQPGAAATLGLFLHADASVAELWVVDRYTNKTVVRRVEIDKSSSSSTPAVLARRSVELLRASLLEILVEPRRAPSAAPAPRVQASRWAAEALAPPHSRWGVEVGALVMGGVGGVGPAILPLARMRASLGELFALRLSLTGLGTRPQVEARDGSATLRQELGLLEILAVLAPRSFIVPTLSLGAGAYHVATKGSAAWPYQGKDDDLFAFAASAGGGVTFPLTSVFALSFEGQAALALPHPVVHILDVDAAETGRPLLLGAATLMGAL